MRVRAEFLALILMSLMVLHNPEGQEMEDAMAEVATRAQAEGDLSPQVRCCVCVRSGPKYCDRPASQASPLREGKCVVVTVPRVVLQFEWKKASLFAILGPQIYRNDQAA